MVWYFDQAYTIKAELLIWFLQKLYQLHPFITGSLEIELLSLKRKKSTSIYTAWLILKKYFCNHLIMALN